MTKLEPASFLNCELECCVAALACFRIDDGVEKLDHVAVFETCKHRDEYRRTYDPESCGIYSRIQDCTAFTYKNEIDPSWASVGTDHD